MNEGYSVRHIPAQEYKVCHGCKWLNTIAGLRGHKKVINDYSCMHPVAQVVPNGYYGDYRWIHFNHEGDCITPSWCPYLKEGGKQ